MNIPYPDETFSYVDSTESLQIDIDNEYAQHNNSILDDSNNETENRNTQYPNQLSSCWHSLEYTALCNDDVNIPERSEYLKYLRQEIFYQHHEQSLDDEYIALTSKAADYNEHFSNSGQLENFSTQNSLYRGQIVDECDENFEHEVEAERNSNQNRNNLKRKRKNKEAYTAQADKRKCLGNETPDQSETTTGGKDCECVKQNDIDLPGFSDQAIYRGFLQSLGISPSTLSDLPEDVVDELKTKIKDEFEGFYKRIQESNAQNKNCDNCCERSESGEKTENSLINSFTSSSVSKKSNCSLNPPVCGSRRHSFENDYEDHFMEENEHGGVIFEAENESSCSSSASSESKIQNSTCEKVSFKSKHSISSTDSFFEKDLNLTSGESKKSSLDKDGLKQKEPCCLSTSLFIENFLLEDTKTKPVQLSATSTKPQTNALTSFDDDFYMTVDSSDDSDDSYCYDRLRRDPKFREEFIKERESVTGISFLDRNLNNNHISSESEFSYHLYSSPTSFDENKIAAKGTSFDENKIAAKGASFDENKISTKGDNYNKFLKGLLVESDERNEKCITSDKIELAPKHSSPQKKLGPQANLPKSDHISGEHSLSELKDFETGYDKTVSESDLSDHSNHTTSKRDENLNDVSISCGDTEFIIETNNSFIGNIKDLNIIYDQGEISSNEIIKNQNIDDIDVAGRESTKHAYDKHNTKKELYSNYRQTNKIELIANSDETRGKKNSVPIKQSDRKQHLSANWHNIDKPRVKSKPRIKSLIVKPVDVNESNSKQIETSLTCDKNPTDLSANSSCEGRGGKLSKTNKKSGRTGEYEPSIRENKNYSSSPQKHSVPSALNRVHSGQNSSDEMDCSVSSEEEQSDCIVITSDDEPAIESQHPPITKAICSKRIHKEKHSKDLSVDKPELRHKRKHSHKKTKVTVPPLRYRSCFKNKSPDICHLRKTHGNKLDKDVKEVTKSRKHSGDGNEINRSKRPSCEKLEQSSGCEHKHTNTKDSHKNRMLSNERDQNDKTKSSKKYNGGEHKSSSMKKSSRQKDSFKDNLYHSTEWGYYSDISTSSSDSESTDSSSLNESVYKKPCKSTFKNHDALNDSWDASNYRACSFVATKHVPNSSVNKVKNRKAAGASWDARDYRVSQNTDNMSTTDAFQGRKQNENNCSVKLSSVKLKRNSVGQMIDVSPTTTSCIENMSVMEGKTNQQSSTKRKRVKKDSSDKNKDTKNLKRDHPVYMFALDNKRPYNIIIEPGCTDPPTCNNQNKNKLSETNFADTSSGIIDKTKEMEADGCTLARQMKSASVLLQPKVSADTLGCENTEADSTAMSIKNSKEPLGDVTKSTTNTGNSHTGCVENVNVETISSTVTGCNSQIPATKKTLTALIFGNQNVDFLKKFMENNEIDFDLPNMDVQLITAGESISNISELTQKTHLLQSYEADVVLLLTGENDIDSKFCTKKKLVFDLRRLLWQVRSSSTFIILCDILPKPSPQYSEFNFLRIQSNRMFRAISMNLPHVAVWNHSGQIFTVGKTLNIRTLFESVKNALSLFLNFVNEVDLLNVVKRLESIRLTSKSRRSKGYKASVKHCWEIIEKCCSTFRNKGNVGICQEFVDECQKLIDTNNSRQWKKQSKIAKFFNDKLIDLTDQKSEDKNLNVNTDSCSADPSPTNSFQVTQTTQTSCNEPSSVSNKSSTTDKTVCHQNNDETSSVKSTFSDTQFSTNHSHVKHNIVIIGHALAHNLNKYIHTSSPKKNSISLPNCDLHFHVIAKQDFRLKMADLLPVVNDTLPNISATMCILMIGENDIECNVACESQVVSGIKNFITTVQSISSSTILLCQILTQGGSRCSRGISHKQCNRRRLQINELLADSYKGCENVILWNHETAIGNSFVVAGMQNMNKIYESTKQALIQNESYFSRTVGNLEKSDMLGEMRESDLQSYSNHLDLDKNCGSSSKPVCPDKKYENVPQQIEVVDQAGALFNVKNDKLGKKMNVQSVEVSDLTNRKLKPDSAKSVLNTESLKVDKKNEIQASSQQLFSMKKSELPAKTIQLNGKEPETFSQKQLKENIKSSLSKSPSLVNDETDRFLSFPSAESVKNKCSSSTEVLDKKRTLLETALVSEKENGSIKKPEHIKSQSHTAIILGTTREIVSQMKQSVFRIRHLNVKFLSEEFCQESMKQLALYPAEKLFSYCPDIILIIFDGKDIDTNSFSLKEYIHHVKQVVSNFQAIGIKYIVLCETHMCFTQHNLLKVVNITEYTNRKHLVNRTLEKEFESNDSVVYFVPEVPVKQKNEIFELYKHIRCVLQNVSERLQLHQSSNSTICNSQSKNEKVMDDKNNEDINQMTNDKRNSDSSSSSTSVTEISRGTSEENTFCPKGDNLSSAVIHNYKSSQIVSGEKRTLNEKLVGSSSSDISSSKTPTVLLQGMPKQKDICLKEVSSASAAIQNSKSRQIVSGEKKTLNEKLEGSSSSDISSSKPLTVLSQGMPKQNDICFKEVSSPSAAIQNSKSRQIVSDEKRIVNQKPVTTAPSDICSTTQLSSPLFDYALSDIGISRKESVGSSANSSKRPKSLEVTAQILHPLPQSDCKRDESLLAFNRPKSSSVHLVTKKNAEKNTSSNQDSGSSSLTHGSAAKQSVSVSKMVNPTVISSLSDPEEEHASEISVSRLKPEPQKCTQNLAHDNKSPLTLNIKKTCTKTDIDSISLNYHETKEINDIEKLTSSQLCDAELSKIYNVVIVAPNLSDYFRDKLEKEQDSLDKNFGIKSFRVKVNKPLHSPRCLKEFVNSDVRHFLKRPIDIIVLMLGEGDVDRDAYCLDSYLDRVHQLNRELKRTFDVEYIVWCEMLSSVKLYSIKREQFDIRRTDLHEQMIKEFKNRHSVFYWPQEDVRNFFYSLCSPSKVNKVYNSLKCALLEAKKRLLNELNASHQSKLTLAPDQSCSSRGDLITEEKNTKKSEQRTDHCTNQLVSNSNVVSSKDADSNHADIIQNPSTSSVKKTSAATIIGRFLIQSLKDSISTTSQMQKNFGLSNLDVDFVGQLKCPRNLINLVPSLSSLLRNKPDILLVMLGENDVDTTVYRPDRILNTVIELLHQVRFTFGIQSFIFCEIPMKKKPLHVSAIQYKGRLLRINSKLKKLFDNNQICTFWPLEGSFGDSGTDSEKLIALYSSLKNALTNSMNKINPHITSKNVPNCLSLESLDTSDSEIVSKLSSESLDTISETDVLKSTETKTDSTSKKGNRKVSIVGQQLVRCFKSIFKKASNEKFNEKFWFNDIEMELIEGEKCPNTLKDFCFEPLEIFHSPDIVIFFLPENEVDTKDLVINLYIERVQRIIFRLQNELNIPYVILCQIIPKKYPFTISKTEYKNHTENINAILKLEFENSKRVTFWNDIEILKNIYSNSLDDFLVLYNGIKQMISNADKLLKLKSSEIPRSTILEQSSKMTERVELTSESENESSSKQPPLTKAVILGRSIAQNLKEFLRVKHKSKKMKHFIMNDIEFEVFGQLHCPHSLEDLVTAPLDVFLSKSPEIVLFILGENDLDSSSYNLIRFFGNIRRLVFRLQNKANVPYIVFCEIIQKRRPGNISYSEFESRKNIVNEKLKNEFIKSKTVLYWEHPMTLKNTASLSEDKNASKLYESLKKALLAAKTNIGMV